MGDRAERDIIWGGRGGGMTGESSWSWCPCRPSCFPPSPKGMKGGEGFHPIPSHLGSECMWVCVSCVFHTMIYLRMYRVPRTYSCYRYAAVTSVESTYHIIGLFVFVAGPKTTRTEVGYTAVVSHYRFCPPFIDTSTPEAYVHTYMPASFPNYVHSTYRPSRKLLHTTLRHRHAYPKP